MTPPHVRHDPHADHEREHDDHGVSLRIPKRIDVDPEDRDRADCDAGLACVVDVGEHHQVDSEPEAHGDDGKVRAPCAQRGQARTATRPPWRWRRRRARRARTASRDRRSTDPRPTRPRQRARAGRARAGRCNPVSTTTDSIITVHARVTIRGVEVVRVEHEEDDRCRGDQSAEAMRGSQRPDPSIGSRSKRCDRSGSARPCTMRTTTITRNGIDLLAPCVLTYRATSDSAIARPIPASSVRGNEEKLPRRHTASAGITRRVVAPDLHARDRHHECAGETSQRTTERPVRTGHEIRGPTECRRRRFALRHRARSETEQCVTGDRPQHERERSCDTEQPQPVLADRHLAGGDQSLR